MKGNITIPSRVYFLPSSRLCCIVNPFSLLLLHLLPPRLDCKLLVLYAYKYTCRLSYVYRICCTHTHTHIYIYGIYDRRTYIYLSLLPPNSSAFLLLFCTEPCFWLIMRLSVHLSSYLGATRIPPSNITIGTHCGVLLLDWVVFPSLFLSGPFFSLYSSSLLGFYFLRKSFGNYKRLFLLFSPLSFCGKKRISSHRNISRLTWACFDHLMASYN